MQFRLNKIFMLIILFLVLMLLVPLKSSAMVELNQNAVFGTIEGSYNSYGHELHYVDHNGEKYILFCTQYGIVSPNGGYYTYENDFITIYNDNLPQYQKMAEMIFFGYAMDYGLGLPTSYEAEIAACCTQQYVWEYIYNNGLIENAIVPDRSSWNNSYMSFDIYNNWLSQTENYYNIYHSNVSFNDTNISVNPKDEIIVTDENGIFQYYETFNEEIDGVIFNHEIDSNNLKITITNNLNSNNVNLNSNNYGIYKKLPNGNFYSNDVISNYVYFHFTSGEIQDLIFSNYIDKDFSNFNISVEIEYGHVLIKKTNESGLPIEGCNFGIYIDEECNRNDL